MFQWPSYEHLSQMDLRKRIKLNGFGFKANTNLYQLKFAFTNGYGSQVVNSLQGTSANPKMFDIHPEKEIAAVEILLRDETNNIYGIKMLDRKDRIIQEKQWRRAGNARWVRIIVPQDLEIIGFHGSHDGSYIKQLGLVLWKPNPTTLPFQR